MKDGDFTTKSTKGWSRIQFPFVTFVFFVVKSVINPSNPPPRGLEIRPHKSQRHVKMAQHKSGAVAGKRKIWSKLRRNSTAAQVGEQDKELNTSALQGIFSAFSQATGQVTGQVAVQVMAACQSPLSGAQIQALIGIKHRETFLDNYLKPLLASGWIQRTIPDKPTSRLQKYRLTEKGRAWLKNGGTVEG